ncbi:hypothetical protein PGIGA_G00159010 [Pangasianodon gigas]|uniref:Uncharacterized protein n=1 Tax=Pangasianodon gigas TaxID=30993 RepID=A0ACC5XQJ0_PANGG|nr:hypothetical protein [Pangasianodon gigas]
MLTTVGLHDNTEAFVELFEQAMAEKGWLETQWAIHLLPLLLREDQLASTSSAIPPSDLQQLWPPIHLQPSSSEMPVGGGCWQRSASMKRWRTSWCWSSLSLDGQKGWQNVSSATGQRCWRRWSNWQ